MRSWIKSFTGRTRTAMPVWRETTCAFQLRYLCVCRSIDLVDSVVFRCKGLQDARKCGQARSYLGNVVCTSPAERLFIDGMTCIMGDQTTKKAQEFRSVVVLMRCRRIRVSLYMRACKLYK